MYTIKNLKVGKTSNCLRTIGVLVIYFIALRSLNAPKYVGHRLALNLNKEYNDGF